MTEGESRFEDLISRGHSAAWEQDWGKAASFYQKALEVNPDNTKVVTSLGLALYELGEFERSQEYYQKAARVDPQDPIPVEKMALIKKKLGQKKEASQLGMKAAELYLGREDVQKAIDNWNRVLNINPYDVRAHARLAMVYQRLGWKQKALKAYIHVASILQDTGRPQKAMEAVERALEILPDNIQALRARDMLKKGQALPLPEKPQVPERVQEQVQQAPQLEGPEREAEPEVTDDPIAEARQRALEIMAQTIFEEDMIHTPPSASARRDLGDLLDGNGSGGVLEGDDSMLKLHVSQAIELQTAERTGQAADELKKAVDLGYEHPAAFYNLGYLYYEAGRLESAIRNLRRSVANSEFGLGSRLLLARIKREKELWEEASKEYLEALRIADTKLANLEERDDLQQLYEAMIDDLEKEEEREAHVQMANHIDGLLVRSDWRQVIRDHRSQADEDDDLLPVVDELVESRRNKVISAHREVKKLSQDGYFGAAMERAFLALRDAPTFLPLHITIGDLLLEQGEQSSAVKKYLAVADVYKVQEKLERALALYKKAIDLAPLNIQVRKRYIDILEGYGQKDQALREYVNLADVYYSLAELESSRDTYQRALEFISAVPHEKDWKKTILNRLADIDIQRLDWDSALAVLKKLREVYPGDSENSKQIVELYYRLEDARKAGHEMERFVNVHDPEADQDKIIQYFEDLKEENPHKAGIRRHFSSYYQSIGDKQKAITELDLLGDMLLDEGDRSGAIRVIEDIIDLNPSNVQEYQKLLDQLME